MTQKIFTRDFRLMLSAQFVFSGVISIFVATLPIYLARLGAREGEIGILVGVFTVTSLIIKPFVGRALLETPEKRILIAGNIIMVLCSFAYLLVRPFFPLLVLRIIQGTGFAFFSTAAFTLVASTASPAHRGQSVSYFFMAMNVAMAVAPAFGILIINHFDFTLLFLTCASLSLCSIFLTFRLEPTRAVPLETQSKKAWPIVSREALSPSIMALITNTVWGGLSAFFPLFAISQGVSNPGVFFTVFAAVLIVGRGFGGKVLDIYNREKVIVPSLAVHIAALIVLSFSTTLPMFILVALLYGAGNCFLYPFLGVFAIERAGSSPGPAMGTFTALMDLGTGLGSVIMGIIVQYTSYQTMFLCLALTSLINLLYYYFFLREKGAHADAHL
jgi:predicted MFS family arabinose efflux permease